MNIVGILDLIRHYWCGVGGREIKEVWGVSAMYKILEKWETRLKFEPEDLQAENNFRRIGVQERIILERYVKKDKTMQTEFVWLQVLSGE
jgi:hypothetical protein